MSEKSTSDKMDNKSAQRPTYKTSGKSYITPQWAKMNPFEAAARINKLERENAALRADKERLDWIARNRSISASERPWSVTPESIRESIDTARKEAQP